MSAIAEKAMLVAVHISIWTARKHDRAVSKEVAVTHNSEEKLGRFNKRLLAEGTKLEAIQTLAGKIRNYFYQNTLPWSDEGLRILPADLYFDLTSKMRDFEQEFHSAVDDFLVEYPEYVRSTRPLLNGLFREEDYPDADKLREKFGVKLEVLPIPSGADFRVQLSEEQKTLIAEKIDANVRESLARSNRDLWFRMYEVVSHFAKRLGDPDARLYASVFMKVAEMAEILPKLNITNDPALNVLAEQVKTQLCQFSVSSLRDNDRLRAETAAKAATLARQMDTTLAELSRSSETERSAAPVETTAGPADPADVPVTTPAAAAPLLFPAAETRLAPEESADAIVTRMSAYMGYAGAACA
jgi:hypothetical protein